MLTHQYSSQGTRPRSMNVELSHPCDKSGNLVCMTFAISYPIYLVYVGLRFGGPGFWGFLAGSIGLMGIIIARLGCASNFRNCDISLKRTLGLLLGFLLAIGFYGGPMYRQPWLSPVGVGLATVALRQLHTRS